MKITKVGGKVRLSGTPEELRALAKKNPKLAAVMTKAAEKQLSKKAQDMGLPEDNSPDHTYPDSDIGGAGESFEDPAMEAEFQKGMAALYSRIFKKPMPQGAGEAALNSIRHLDDDSSSDFGQGEGANTSGGLDNFPDDNDTDNTQPPRPSWMQPDDRGGADDVMGQNPESLDDASDTGRFPEGNAADGPMRDDSSDYNSNPEGNSDDYFDGTTPSGDPGVKIPGAPTGGPKATRNRQPIASSDNKTLLAGSSRKGLSKIGNSSAYMNDLFKKLAAQQGKNG